MTRETKVGLLVGMGVILLIGIIVSDHLSVVQQQEAAELSSFANQSQDSIDTAERSAPDAAPDASSTARREPIPTPEELDSRDRRRSDVQAMPTAFQVEGGRRGTQDEAAMQEPPALNRGQARQGGRMFADRQPPRQPEHDADHAVPTLHLSHEQLARASQQNRQQQNRRRVEQEPDDSVQLISDLAIDRIENADEPDQPRQAGADEDRSEIIHEVERGETLYDIAAKYYSNGSYWKALAEHNADVVGSEGRVRAEDRLVIPDRAGLALRDEFVDAGSERTVSLDELGDAVGASEPTTVQVRAGDTLSALAQRHLGSSRQWRELLEANRDRLSSAEELREGMELILPGSAAGDTGSADAESASPTTRTYTVKSGDTLSSIAQQVLGSSSRWRDLLEANPDQLDDPDDLRVGQELQIPSRS